MTKTDLELYDSMCSGDKSALESIYSKYERLLYSYAYKMTSSHEVSEEIVQDVFTKLWQNKNPYDAGKAKMSTWLITITRNSVIDLFGKKNLNTYEYNEMDDIESSTDMFNSTVEKSAESHENQRIICTAMSSLSEEQKYIITLFYFKAYSHSQIAGELNIPLGTVKSRIRLALGHLKKNINQERGHSR